MIKNIYIACTFTGYEIASVVLFYATWVEKFLCVQTAEKDL